METYLAHHGILGMKWGVRRYQNKDGTLTASGKVRYEKNGISARVERRSSDSKRDVKSMSDAQLRNYINRYNLEKQYMDAISKTSSQKGKIKTDDILQRFGNVLIQKIIETSAQKAANKIVSEAIKLPNRLKKSW